VSAVPSRALVPDYLSGMKLKSKPSRRGRKR
jgi:hypothetical protein